MPKNDRTRYRTGNGKIATNVLGVCSQDMKFIFIKAEWEGSTSGSRVICNALNKLTGLKVPASITYLKKII